MPSRNFEERLKIGRKIVFFAAFLSPKESTMANVMALAIDGGADAKNIFQALPVEAWAAIGALVVVLMLCVCFLCFYYCTPPAYDEADLAMAKQFKAGQGPGHAPTNQKYHSGSRGPGSSGDYDLEDPTGTRNGNLHTKQLVHDLNAQPSKALSNRLQRHRSDKSGFSGVSGISDNTSNLTKAAAQVHARTIEPVSLANDLSANEKAQLARSQTAPIQNTLGTSFSRGNGDFNPVPGSPGGGLGASGKSRVGAAGANSHNSIQSNFTNLTNLSKSNKNKANSISNSNLNSNGQNPNMETAWEPSSPSRHKKGLSYGRLDPEAQQRVASIRLQAEEMNLLPFKVAPTAASSPLIEEVIDDQNGNANGNVGGNENQSQPSNSRTHRKKEKNLNGDGKGSGSGKAPSRPKRDVERRPASNAKALKMLGVSELDVSQPYSEPVKKRIERIAKGAGPAGYYNAGFSTASLGNQIIEGFQERRDKIRIKKEEREKALADMKEKEEKNLQRRKVSKNLSKKDVKAFLDANTNASTASALNSSSNNNEVPSKSGNNDVSDSMKSRSKKGGQGNKLKDFLQTTQAYGGPGEVSVDQSKGEGVSAISSVKSKNKKNGKEDISPDNDDYDVDV